MTLLLLSICSRKPRDKAIQTGYSVQPAAPPNIIISRLNRVFLRDPASACIARLLIGETGFEPATARPPATMMGCHSGDEARIHWVFCLPMLFSFAQFVPRSVPRAYVRIGFATPPSAQMTRNRIRSADATSWSSL